MKHPFMIITGLALLCACKKQMPASSACTDQEGLYHFADFPIGVAVHIDSLRFGSLYQKTVGEQFNSITPENIFKPSFLHPGEQQYNWFLADVLADYCQRTNKRLHGHTLIWHQQLPAWLENYKGTPGQWEQVFKDHIQTIVTHFKGKVRAWDVVNEAFNEDGTLRQTLWLEHLGSGYLEKAFRYAHAADPDALLFYNDYLLETNPAKRSAVISCLNTLRARGVQIDGIGMQFHINTLYPDMSQVADAFKDVSGNSYQIHISELDISVNPFYKDIEPGGELYERQADILGAVVLHYKEVPAKYRYGLTFWGLNDANSWVPSYFGREDYPLIYDSHYAPKPAYCKLKEIL